jgi:hypothetical protein
MRRAPGTIQPRYIPRPAPALRNPNVPSDRAFNVINRLRNEGYSDTDILDIMNNSPEYAGMEEEVGNLGY